MPLWNFECEKCGKRELDVAGAKCDSKVYAPTCCGEKMFNDISAARTFVSVFESYTTTNIHPDGKELHVRNSGDLKRFETEFGVKRVDDPGLKSHGGEFVRDRSHKGRVFI